MDNAKTKPPAKKRRWLRLLLELLVIVALVFAIRAWQQKDMVTGIAPEFHSAMLDGKVVSLKDYRGKPLLLHFWASWCPFCKFEESGVSSIKDDWQVLTVAYQSGGKAEIEKHMIERNITDWPTIADPDSQLADLFGVKGVPTTLILDSEGNIRFTEVGVTSAWGLRARLWWADKFKGNKSSSVESVKNVTPQKNNLNP